MNIYIRNTSSNDEFIYKKKQNKNIYGNMYIGVVSFLISYDTVQCINFFKAERKKKR